ncbi:Hypothetical predicted protein [Lecanosticta acicola]|uniref:Steroid 5-alpha reductase C-terminal domain-containing protein n=1 Tax=Lecanosticta acicola TaxID=111012 RepID=A0AAI8YWH0_9PEZI|nr:Hypothetical predicted protein [Lecanosticta acicola]
MTATASEMGTLGSAKEVLQEPSTYRAAHLLGITERSMLPSLGLHGGLSLVAYGIARTTNRVDLKDYLWATGMVANAWYTAVGRHMIFSPRAASFAQALSNLSYSQQALLGAVTAWGTRLTYRVVSRSLARGKDDPRYEVVKKQPGFWNKATLLFGLEAVFQSLISLPFTTAFRTDLLSGFTGAPSDWAPWVRWSAAGLFTAGLFLETIADWQIDSHKKREAVKKEQGGSGELLRSGVWSIVRHPNYLGDALCHFAFPLWTYGTGLFSWAQVAGPLANYFFLRFIGGDRENEASQAERYAKEDREKHSQFELYQLQKHAFWPSVFEIANPWTWVVASVGALGAAATWWAESKLGEAVMAVNPVDPKIGEELASLA